MAGYRDEGEAAMHRVAALEQELVEVKERSATLEKGLVEANAEIIRLQRTPITTGAIPASAPVANTWIAWGTLIVAGLMLVPLAFASYQSERGGMAVAHLAVPCWGAVLGAWTTKRRSVAACLGATIGGAVLTVLLLGLFFATIWRSL